MDIARHRGVCRHDTVPWPSYAPLYSRKLHIRVRRASTSCVTSFTILAFVLLGSVWNHFARRTLPVLS